MPEHSAARCVNTPSDTSSVWAVRLAQFPEAPVSMHPYRGSALVPRNLWTVETWPSDLGVVGYNATTAGVRPDIPGWSVEVVEQLDEVLILPPDWDSYGGKQISLEAANSVLAFLNRILPVSGKAPTVVPLGNGGIQLEWHCSGLDVEIDFEGTQSSKLYVLEIESGNEWEDNPEELFRRLGLAQRLSQT